MNTRLEIVVYNFEYDKPYTEKDHKIKHVCYYIPTIEHSDSYDPVECFRPDLLKQLLDRFDDDVTEEVSLYCRANSDAKRISDVVFEKDDDGYFICELA